LLKKKSKAGGVAVLSDVEIPYPELNLALSASFEYAKYLPVLLESVYRSQPAETINVFIFFSDERVFGLRERLKAQASQHASSINLVLLQVPSESAEGLNAHPGWAVDLWYRWFVLDMLPLEVDRVLVVGVDTFFRKNLQRFFSQEMAGFWFAGVADMWQKYKVMPGSAALAHSLGDVGESRKNRWDNFAPPYVNADFVLVNLRETRGRLSTERFFNCQRSLKFVDMDQGVINLGFRDRLKTHEDLSLNYFPNLGLNDVADDVFYEEAALVQFCGGPKPWVVGPYRAKGFAGVDQWWSLAREIGELDSRVKIYYALRDVWLFIKPLLGLRKFSLRSRSK